MISVRIGEDRIDMDEKYISFSPYLSAGLSFARMNRRNTVQIEDDAEVSFISRRTVDNYISFLQGEDFTMTEEDEAFFDFMGHCNKCEYALDYWKMKIRSQWIRHNFYRLNLKDRDGGLYGLTEVPITRKIVMDFNNKPVNIDSVRDKVVIAGGAALYMSGMSDDVGDIDLFSLSKNTSLKYFANLNTTNRMKMTANSYNHSCGITITQPYGTQHKFTKLSLIAREYTCPAEIVHGFDLDACQFIVVYENGNPRLYATELGLRAAKMREQWYDPEMISTTYIQRLHKYKKRGIGLRLPMIVIGDVHHTIRGISTSSYIKCATVLDYQQHYNIVKNAPHHMSDSGVIRKSLVDMGIPRDIGTVLIIVAFFNISSFALNVILNNGRRLTRSYDLERHDDYEPEWIIRNPMKQDVLSGIFYPIDQEDILTMYMKSPLYVNSGLSIPMDVRDQYPIIETKATQTEEGRWVVKATETSRSAIPTRLHQFDGDLSLLDDVIAEIECEGLD